MPQGVALPRAGPMRKRGRPVWLTMTALGGTPPTLLQNSKVLVIPARAVGQYVTALRVACRCVGLST